MADYTRDQLMSALRKADAAGDTAAAKAIAKRVAAMDAKPKPKEDSWLDGLVKGTVATVKGAAKAVAGPIDLAMEAAGGVNQAINYGLTEGGAAALGLVGADNAAKRLRQSGAEQRAIAGSNANALQFRNALDTVAPTPKGYGAQEVASEFITGAAIPFKTARPGPAAPRAPNALTDAQKVVAEGAKRKVPVMTTDVVPPKSGAGRYIKQTLPEKIPFAGTSGNRAAQQAARQNAVREVVEEFGGDTGRALFDDGDTLTQQVAKQLAEQRGAKLTALKTAKDSVIQKATAPFDAAPNTVRAVNEQVRRLQGIDADEYAPVIQRLQRFGDNLTSGKTLEQVEGQRKLLGDLFADPNLAAIKGEGQKAINSIYDPLRRDMGDFIERQLGGAERMKWAKANEQLAAMAGDLKSTAFKNVLKQTDVTPEAVSRILFGSADNTSDMARLVSNLDAAGKRKVQGALMTRAWEKASGTDGVSVEVFLNNLDRLSGKIGVAFKGEDRAALVGVTKLLNATRRAAKAGADLQTGDRAVLPAIGIAATQALGVTGGVASLGVGGLLARVYESAPVRNLLIGLSKTNPGSTAESAIVRQIMRVSAPVVNNWKDEVARAANDNLGALAAQDSQGDEQETQ